MDETQREVAEAREMLIREEQLAYTYTQKNRDKEALNGLEASLHFLREAKPKKQSELARRYAVAITELEKSLAFFKFYVIDQG